MEELENIYNSIIDGLVAANGGQYVARGDIKRVVLQQRYPGVYTVVLLRKDGMRHDITLSPRMLPFIGADWRRFFAGLGNAWRQKDAERMKGAANA